MSKAKKVIANCDEVLKEATFPGSKGGAVPNDVKIGTEVVFKDGDEYANSVARVFDRLDNGNLMVSLGHAKLEIEPSRLLLVK